MGLKPGHGLGRVGLIIEHHQLHGKPSVSHLNSPGGIDALNGNVIAMFQVVSYRRIAASQWDHGADLDGLGNDLDARTHDQQHCHEPNLTCPPHAFLLLPWS
jgi:hypothetical protein